MNEQCSFAKVAASQSVCIPAQLSSYIQAFGGNGEHICVVESSRVLSGNLRVVESVVKGRSFVNVVNPTSRYVWLNPRTRLGIRKPAQMIGDKDLRVDVATD